MISGRVVVDESSEQGGGQPGMFLKVVSALMVDRGEEKRFLAF